MPYRHDLVQISDPRIDQNGYLVADAFPTRTGVFKYVNPGGKVTRELRHPDEVFKQESLDSLKHRPIIDEHPGGPADTRNTARLSVGHVGEQVSQMDQHVKANLIITDAKMIAKIQGEGGKPKKLELSCGYTADVVEESGVYEGEKYDHVQRDIVYNHLASVWTGRAGPTAKIHLDAEDAVIQELISDGDVINTQLSGRLKKLRDEKKLSNQDLATAAGVDVATMVEILSGEISRPPDKRLQGLAKRLGVTFQSLLELTPADRREEGNPGSKHKDTMTIKRKLQAVTIGDYRQDGIELTYPEEAGEAVNSLSDRLDQANTQLKVMTDRYDADHAAKKKADGERDQSKDELEKEKKKHRGDGIDPVKLDEMAAERADVLGVAGHLGIKDVVGRSNEELKTAVVQKHNPDLKMDGMDPKVVEGRYDMICDGIMKENKAIESLAQLKKVMTPDMRTDVSQSGEFEPSPREKLHQDLASMHGKSEETVRKDWAN